MQIDNATIAQMCTLLSDNSSYTFIYKGKNKEMHDWSLMINNELATLISLRDMGFEINETKKKVMTYRVH